MKCLRQLTRCYYIVSAQYMSTIAIAQLLVFSCTCLVKLQLTCLLCACPQMARSF